MYEKMKKANLLPSKKEDGKDPLGRMLLDTMDAALVGALVAVSLAPTKHIICFWQAT